MAEKRPRKTMYCETHGDTEHSLFKIHGSKYEPKWKCLACWNEAKKVKYRRNKIKAVEHKGGPICSVCGEDFTGRLECLDFHHENPEEKEIGLGKIMMGGWPRIEQELDKCILLCSNCHRTLHKGGLYV